MSYEKFYTLQEIKAARPMFFENAGGPESYVVRKNHLIVCHLGGEPWTPKGKIMVWQFHHWFDGSPALSPIFHSTTLSRQQVITLTEKRLENGRWPLYTEDFRHSGRIEYYEKELE